MEMFIRKFSYNLLTSFLSISRHIFALAISETQYMQLQFKNPSSGAAPFHTNRVYGYTFPYSWGVWGM